MKNEKLATFLADDDAMKLLKTIDEINPPEVPVNRISTIRGVAEVMGWTISETWNMCNKGVEAGVLMYYGGVLSRKRVDLTDFGEEIVDAEGTEELRKIIRGTR